MHVVFQCRNHPSLNGGVRDYTEFQSQLLERWLSTDEVINRFLKPTMKPAEVIPKELIAKIKKTSTFNGGLRTTEYLASGIDGYDYTCQNQRDDPDKFERETLAELNMPNELRCAIEHHTLTCILR